MKSNSIQRTMLATLIVFAASAIGLRPSVFNSGSGCTCEAKVSAGADESVGESSCCISLAEEQLQTDCCSSKPTMTKKCCCNPKAAVCECGDCGCSEVNDSNSPLPAIPTSETSEVVSPTLICAAPFVGYPCESKAKRVDYQNAVAEYAALSSHQTCVLLSRFTC